MGGYFLRFPIEEIPEKKKSAVGSDLSAYFFHSFYHHNRFSVSGQSFFVMIHEKEADIIFMDPPYNQGYEAKTLAALADKPYVTENTLIIVEAKLSEDFSFAAGLGYRIEREKNYKTNKHVFLRKEQGKEG